MNSPLTPRPAPATPLPPAAPVLALAPTERGEGQEGQGMSVSENVRKCPSPPGTLSPKQCLAIDLLVLGKKTSDIARAVDVDPRTIYRWRHDSPDFIQELQRRSQELIGDAAARLKAMIHPSLDVLEKDLADRFPQNRHRAAATVLRLTDLRKALRHEEPN